MITDIEKALSDGSAPWKEIEFRTTSFWIFRDYNNAPCEGYLCFVPAQKTMECLFETYKAAYKWGYEGISLGRWEGFNLLQSVGDIAGQNGLYPHIHMIPRREGDLEQ